MHQSTSRLRKEKSFISICCLYPFFLLLFSFHSMIEKCFKNVNEVGQQCLLVDCLTIKVNNVFFAPFAFLRLPFGYTLPKMATVPAKKFVRFYLRKKNNSICLIVQSTKKASKNRQICLRKITIIVTEALNIFGNKN